LRLSTLKAGVAAKVAAMVPVDIKSMFFTHIF
jgi:hypothetical protein